MSDLNQPLSNAALSSSVLADTGWDNAYDDALGCECAYPALQIEQWGQEITAPAGASH